MVVACDGLPIEPPCGDLNHSAKVGAEELEVNQIGGNGVIAVLMMLIRYVNAHVNIAKNERQSG